MSSEELFQTFIHDWNFHSLTLSREPMPAIHCFLPSFQSPQATLLASVFPLALSVRPKTPGSEAKASSCLFMWQLAQSLCRKNVLGVWQSQLGDASVCFKEATRQPGNKCPPLAANRWIRPYYKTAGGSETRAFWHVFVSFSFKGM